MRRAYKRRSHDSCEPVHGLTSGVPDVSHLNTMTLELLHTVLTYNAGSDINNLPLINDPARLSIRIPALH
ncbi:unnamed protein product [Lasius platythorax]|uniref:Uncharacterized protein n=1 Tax=Lasius platythorax TaxID=488582 RepID=A0AAV2P7X0_9HYME